MDKNSSTCTFCGRTDIGYAGNCETKRMCNFIPDVLEHEEMKEIVNT